MNTPAVGRRLFVSLVNLRAAAHEVRRALQVADEADRAALRGALSDIYDVVSTCEAIERAHAPSTGATS